MGRRRAPHADGSGRRRYGHLLHDKKETASGNLNTNDTSGTTAGGNSNAAVNASPPTEVQGLTGIWTGTYGLLNSPARLIIKEQKGGKWAGVLEQGEVQVAVSGSVDLSSRRVTFKETEVLKGSGWSLGDNAGAISPDGRKISGTGKDAVGGQLGISYEWSFSKSTG